MKHQQKKNYQQLHQTISKKKLKQKKPKKSSSISLDEELTQEEIKRKARQSIDKEQKEYFLRHQLRAIRKELGEEDDKLREIEEYKEKIKKVWDKKMKYDKRFKKINILIARVFLDLDISAKDLENGYRFRDFNA